MAAGMSYGPYSGNAACVLCHPGTITNKLVYVAPHWYCLIHAPKVEVPELPEMQELPVNKPRYSSSHVGSKRR